MTTSIFSGTLAVGETRVHTFPAAASSSAQATLASLTNAAGDLVASPVTLAIGTPTDSGCTPIATAAAHPAFVSQVSATVSSGLYCVSVSDSGNLGDSVKYSVRVVHP
jgi:hypothetical protein